LQLVKQEAANLTYERFSQAVDDLVGKDKDWTSFVFAFCVGKRIVKHSQEFYSTTKNYFQQYIAQSYSQTLRESGGVVSRMVMIKIIIVMIMMMMMMNNLMMMMMMIIIIIVMIVMKMMD